MGQKNDAFKTTRDRYDEISILLPKGTRDTLRNIASEMDAHSPQLTRPSINRLIIEALENTYHIDLSTPNKK